jgi:hypothetical protein
MEISQLAMVKFGFRIKTRNGMVVDNLSIAAPNRAEAERKLTQIYHNCEVLACQELQPTVKESFDLESAIDLIGKQSNPDAPAKTD